MQIRTLAALACLLVVMGCGGPFLVVPGGALKGEVVTTAPPNWSFASDRFLDLEVRPDDPYSVKLNYVLKDGQLFIDPAEGRNWFDHLRANPNVRVRLGGKVYPARAVFVGKPGEVEGFPKDRYVYRLDLLDPPD